MPELGHCHRRQGCREVLADEAGIEVADKDAVDVLGLEAGAVECGLDRVPDHLLQVQLVEFPEGRVAPSDDV